MRAVQIPLYAPTPSLEPPPGWEPPHDKSEELPRGAVVFDRNSDEDEKDSREWL